jgi:EAL domain-containing protein (putative c-di-GMP-specific phosphodiesterase class I)
MYRAKALGKARHEVFAVGMLREVIDRFQMESDIRQGIEQQEFSLHYQPVMSLKTGAIAGFEALARWRHRQRGYISPGAFIPIAEETGLIVPLGEWIFREACRQLYIWQQQFPQEPPLTMSINISGRQVIGTDLTRQLADILEETGVEGRCIKVELTESMVMNDVEAAIDLMLSLKELNLQLGIDDFGTGYSSLSYLHRFPMDTLKVDRSFISRIETGSEDIEIVRAIIALGHNLGMEIVAEGLETESQVQLLRQLNCEYGQGFFFAKPLSTAQAADFLKSPLQR